MSLETANNLLLSNRQNLNGQWQFRQVGEKNWMSATVPGSNFTDLFQNGIIRDPFYRCEEQSLQWIELHDWEYKLVFDAKPNLIEQPRINLIFDGLDTYCDVYLNSVLLLTSANMFVGHNVDCKSALKEHNNELHIIFKSPIKEVYPQYLKKGFVYPAENDKTEQKLSVYTRKAPYHYGWDWGPKFVTSGIWRDVRLEAHGVCKLSTVDYEVLSIDSKQASLIFNVELDEKCSSTGVVVVTCDQEPDLSVVAEINVSSKLLKLAISLKNPNLWWPNGLGEAYLYGFTIELVVDKLVCDSKHINVGLRTIEVVNQPDADGESFFIKVNGHPVFMKGANYIPSDSFLTRVNEQKYQTIFDDAVNANMNMLRVWGGGVYESDEFYRLADQNGILIWQDFMFACTLYPGDKAFIDNVVDEVEYNIKRLKNHPCLALWCGNNEVEMGISDWQWPEKFSYTKSQYAQLKSDYVHLFQHVLPDLVAKFDPNRFYFSSSPISFWENQQDDNKGDNHYWGVWHGEQAFEEFRNRVPRFMSEYGFQSFPVFDSVKQYSIAEDWHIESDVMKLHQKHPRGNQLITQYMLAEYRQPKDFESFLYMSQIVQSQGMKVAFEAHRQAMPFCMGTLYWQFNDCWPVASWSSIDYYGNWKALHYQAKRSFAATAVFIADSDNTLSVDVVSDLLESRSLRLAVSLLSFDGSVLWQDELVIDVKGNAKTQILSIEKESFLKQINHNEVAMVATIYPLESKSVLSEAVHYLVPTKDLNLQVPAIQMNSLQEETDLFIELKSDTLVRQLYIKLADQSGNFSDNFFDLLPGRTKRVRVSMVKGKTLSERQVKQQLRLMSVVDSYNA